MRHVLVARAWQEWQHPRDWRGRFITKGVHVRLSGGLIGTVTEVRRARREGETALLTVETRDGRTGQIPSDRVTVAEPPRGTAFIGDGTVASVGDEVGHTDEPGYDYVKSVNANGSITVGARGTNVRDREVDPSTLTRTADMQVDHDRSLEQAADANTPEAPNTNRTTGPPLARIKRALPRARVSLERLDPELAVHVADAIEDVVAMFPILAESRTLPSIALARSSDAHTYAQARADTGSVNLDPRWFGAGQAATLRRQYQRDQRSDWFAASKDLDPAYALVVHELGHVVHRAVEQRNGGRLNDRRALTELGIGATEIISRAARGAGEPRPWTRQEIGRDLSKYGASLPVETIAEAFTEAVTAGANARPMARALTNELIRRGNLNVTLPSPRDEASPDESDPLAPEPSEQDAVRDAQRAGRTEIQPAPEQQPADVQPEAEQPVGTPEADPRTIGADGRPIAVGERITVNGRTGEVTNVRPGSGIIVYHDGERLRSARIDRTSHVEDAGEVTSQPEAETPPVEEPSGEEGGAAIPPGESGAPSREETLLDIDDEIENLTRRIDAAEDQLERDGGDMSPIQRRTLEDRIDRLLRRRRETRAERRELQRRVNEEAGVPGSDTEPPSAESPAPPAPAPAPAPTPTPTPLTTRNVNRVLEDLGIPRATRPRAQRDHRGRVVPTTAQAVGYETRATHDGGIDVSLLSRIPPVNASERQREQWRADEAEQMRRIREALEARGWRVQPGPLNNRVTAYPPDGSEDETAPDETPTSSPPTPEPPPAPPPPETPGPATDERTLGADGVPVAVGERIEVNGRRGRVTHVRPGSGIVVYHDEEADRARSAQIRRVRHFGADPRDNLDTDPPVGPPEPPPRPAAEQPQRGSLPDSALPDFETAARNDDGTVDSDVLMPDGSRRRMRLHRDGTWETLSDPPQRSGPPPVSDDPNDYAGWGDRAQEIASSAGPDLADLPRRMRAAANREGLSRRVTAEIENMYNGPNGLGSDGYTVRLQPVRSETYSSGEQRVFITGRIHDRNGDFIGQITRTINYRNGVPYEVHNDYLQLFSDRQGTGFAKDLYRRQENWLIKQRVPKITIHANIDVGGYTWARMGYDYQTRLHAESHLTTLMNRARRAYGTDHPATRQLAAWRDDLRDNPATTQRPTAFEVSRLGHTPGATTWPGKELMLGTDWQAVKFLDPPPATPVSEGVSAPGSVLSPAAAR